MKFGTKEKKVNGSTKSEGIQHSELMENLGDEMAVALSICVNVEEIIADRLLIGGNDSNFVRMELQNIDRLIQMMTDFRALVIALSKLGIPHDLPTDEIREALTMRELADRLFSENSVRRGGLKTNGSDLTFF